MFYFYYFVCGEVETEFQATQVANGGIELRNPKKAHPTSPLSCLADHSRLRHKTQGDRQGQLTRAAEMILLLTNARLGYLKTWTSPLFEGNPKL